MDIFPSKLIKKYDKNKNLIYSANCNYKIWREFDEKGNEIYLKQLNIFGTYYEEWRKYDENNREIYYRDTRYILEGEWYKYNKNNEQIERIKLYLNNKRINRFSLMDI